MVKRKAATTVEPGLPANSAQVAGAAPEDEAPPEPTLPYLVGKWHGMTQYRCPQCPFDALEEETILEHIAAHWVEEQAQATPGSGLVLVADKSGNQR